MTPGTAQPSSAPDRAPSAGRWAPAGDSEAGDSGGDCGAVDTAHNTSRDSQRTGHSSHTRHHQPTNNPGRDHLHKPPFTRTPVQYHDRATETPPSATCLCTTSKQRFRAAAAHSTCRHINDARIPKARLRHGVRLPYTCDAGTTRKSRPSPPARALLSADSCSLQPAAVPMPAPSISHIRTSSSASVGG